LANLLACFLGRLDGLDINKCNLMYASESERRRLEWWPEFVRDIFAAIGTALNGKSLNPETDYDIEAPWSGHRIRITYFTAKDLEKEFGTPQPYGVYLVETIGPMFGGGRWEFRQQDLDALVAAAMRAKPTQH
jgi:hypothetical protein